MAPEAQAWASTPHYLVPLSQVEVLSTAEMAAATKTTPKCNLLHTKHDLAEVGVTFHVAMGLAHVFQGEHRVNY